MADDLRAKAREWFIFVERLTEENRRLRAELAVALRRFKTIRSTADVDVVARALRLGINDLEAALGQKED